MRKETIKGYRWLYIEDDVFKNEGVDAVKIDIRGVSVVFHKPYDY